MFSYHGPLLSKGLALSSVPTVQQALDGILPYRSVDYSSLQIFFLPLTLTEINVTQFDHVIFFKFIYRTSIIVHYCYIELIAKYSVF